MSFCRLGYVFVSRITVILLPTSTASAATVTAAAATAAAQQHLSCAVGSSTAASPAKRCVCERASIASAKERERESTPDVAARLAGDD